MAIGRSRYAPPYTSSTKGHSVLKQRSYAMPTRNPPAANVSRAAAYDTRGEEYLLADRVSNVNYLSNTLMDEGYDTALKSRGRDQQLLREATNAIPRRSLRDTTTLTSSVPSFGSRRFPRRFGKTRFRKNQSSSVYDTPDEGKSITPTTSTSELMASVGPSPFGSWRRYGRPRSSSAARSSFLEDDDVSLDRSAYSSRASSIGPSPSSNITLSTPLSRPSSSSRRSLPPFPVTNVSERQVLDRSSKSWGQSVSPSRFGSLSSPTRAKLPLTREYEPDIAPSYTAPRRRQKVLASSRRPAGNYYERLLRKRGKQGRFGPYYDLESIEGSDLSGVLSDEDFFDEYSGASLLLSVEGAGLSPEGKRVDFTYTPPPIPLYGRTVGLDEKLLGIKPSPTSIKPLDDFISGYMKRMGALRAALTDRLDKDREKRVQYGLQPLDTGPRPSSTYTSYTRSYTPSYTPSYYSSSYTPSYTRRSYTRSSSPSYTQSYDYVPVKHLSSQKTERMPVTSFRRRHDDGHTHRLDVFSLGEFRPRLSSSTERAITIPESATGGHQLSVLDKINIKAAIIASKLEPDPIKRRRPRSEFAANKYRELRKEALESSTGTQGSGQGSSNGVEGSTRPVSDLRRRLRRTLNKSRVS